MKATFHKSCSCRSCKRGRGSIFGQYIRKVNEKKLRRTSKQALDLVKRGSEEDAVVAPITSPYTD